jgi:hypothetical protein
LAGRSNAGISTAYPRQLLLEKHDDAVVASQQALNQSLAIISKKIAYYKELNAKDMAVSANTQ